MNTARPLAVAFVLVAASTAHAGPIVPQSDNFDDGIVGTQWSVVADNPSQLDIAEAGGVLGITSNGAGSLNDDALYLSDGVDGFRLSTATAFSMTLDYNFTGTPAGTAGNDALTLVFGVGRDLDGTDSAAIGYGRAELADVGFNAGAIAFRDDDVQTVLAPDFGAPTVGTFAIDYEPGTDTLTLGIDGTTTPLVGLVQGSWAADALFVSLGVRGTGFAASPADTFVDNFTLISGDVIVPEPTSIGLLAFGGLVLRRRR